MLIRPLPVLALGLVAVGVCPLLAADASAGEVRGSYIEARTADVYTGPCFANAELNLTGKEAVMAWKVEQGSWAGVSLTGRSVVAVVRAEATLGDPENAPRSRAVVLVDEGADAGQRDALVAMARHIGGDLLADVVSIEAEPIRLTVGDHGSGTLRAGDVAAVTTRGLEARDHLCGNEVVFYPPLVPGVEAHPAVALEHFWSGQGLGMTWRSADKRSAFVGTFSASP